MCARTARQRLILSIAMAVALVCSASTSAAVDFEKGIKPIIESACLHCHNEAKAEGDLRLDSLAFATADAASGPSIVAGDPEKSSFYLRTVLSDGDEQIMPPEGARLDASQTSLLKKWIEEGAKWPNDSKLEVRPRIDFVKHVQPILEMNCVSCHSAENREGDFDLSTREAAFTSGSEPPAIKAFDPAASQLYLLTILAKDDAALMPPMDQGGPLTKESIDVLRLWISQGAIWPEDQVLRTRAKKFVGPPNPDDLALVQRIHDMIVERAKAEKSEFASYSAKVPQTSAPYDMVAIKGGEFRMGSPEEEENRADNEGPQAQVQVDSFWLGKYEVTWNEFEPYMITAFERYKNGARKDYHPATHTIVDAVSGPTKPYADMTFGMGKLGYPAICMTQHAANKYCEWLSAQTGHFYRLPTEAEWEYACRAGSTTAYSFGDSSKDLRKFAWYYENSNEKSQKVGQKKPNPWGLYDMHGNVMEWTADQYVPEYFQRLAGRASNPFVRPELLYPRSARGGSWDNDPEQLRSAYRVGSEASWQQQDPQLPKSIWYLTDAPWLGFRIARPEKLPSVEEMYFYWNSSTDKH
jgi:formylglycine-generating enzyme required for sulfatase activity